MFACIYVPPSHPQILAANSAPSPASFADALLRLAFCFSPRVEPLAPGTMLLDIAGTEPLFGPPEQLAQTMAARAAQAGFQASVAIARNTPAAIYAARGFPGATIIPVGREAKILSSLPLSLLSASPELPQHWPQQLEETWQRWGLRTFGDLAALPETGVAERLGPEGARLHRIARGAEDRPLIPFIPVPEFEAAQELEYPVELLEPLAFILASLLHQVCATLEARGKAAIELRLRCKLQHPADSAAVSWERQLRLPVPLRDSLALLQLLRLDLEVHPPQAPILAVSLRAEPAEPRATQNHLFVPPSPEPARLELTLARIAKLVGAENAGAPALLDTHRPGAFAIHLFRVVDASHKAEKTISSKEASGHDFSHAEIWVPTTRASAPEVCPSAAKAARKGNGVAPITARLKSCPDGARLSFRAFRPPLCAAVECAHGRPVRVRARGGLHGIRGDVVSLAGPWRTSGDWWTLEPWEREEWEIELRPFSVTSVRRNQGRGIFLIHSNRDRNRLYRIYCDLSTNLWHVAGSYD